MTSFVSVLYITSWRRDRCSSSGTGRESRWDRGEINRTSRLAMIAGINAGQKGPSS
ncbi:uncharacterized protein LOC111134071 isoform X2 [Crassostrea virginica]